MKLSKAFGIFIDIRFAVSVALYPTLLAIWKNPWLLLHPHQLSRTFMANVWASFADLVDGWAWVPKQSLLPPHAHGVVLDIGAGHGHTVFHLDRKMAKKYVALEPNLLMHGQIRKNANEAGFHESDNSLVILACGAEDIACITSELGGLRTVDTVVSILSLCTIPDPQRTINVLVQYILKPGGALLIYEHVLNPRKDVQFWQRLWTPMWSAVFGGCKLDRPTVEWIEKVELQKGKSAWKEKKVWGKDGESEDSLFFHRVGIFVKRD